MKYLKTFESYSDNDLAKKIAEDIFPTIQKIRDEKGIFTESMFDNFMEERKGDMKLTDEVILELVEMGFQFDYDEDDSEDFDNEPRGDFEGYPGMEYSLN
jgi:hypothetical protein